MNAPKGIKQAWQATSLDVDAPSIDKVRRSASAFDRQIRIRNAIEYVACIFVIVMFSIGVFRETAPLMKLSAALIVAGTCFVMWQLWRRGSVPEAPTTGATSELIKHHRHHLVRQRDALDSILLWYLLPFAPGMMLSFFAVPIVPGKEWAKATSILLTIAVFAGVWWLNKKGARRLQRAIDDLDAMTGEME
jgi:hypothetical protein